MSSRPLKRDYQEFYKRYDQLQPRLLSLEVTLQNAAKSGQLGASEYQARQNLITQLRHRLLTAHQWIYESQSNPKTDIDFGMPGLESCSYEEVLVCDHFLTQRLSVCQSMISYLESLYHMITPAAQKKIGALKTIFTLSKIKKAIDKLDEDARRVDIDEKQAHQQAHDLATQLKGKMTPRADGEVMESLIHLFDDLDGLTSRIARLKQSAQTEEQQIREMNQWLFENEVILTQRPAPVPPPSAADLEESERMLRSPSLNPVAKAEERLAIAREFVENYVNLRKREALSTLPDLPPQNESMTHAKH